MDRLTELETQIKQIEEQEQDLEQKREEVKEQLEKTLKPFYEEIKIASRPFEETIKQIDAQLSELSKKRGNLERAWRIERLKDPNVVLGRIYDWNKSYEGSYGGIFFRKAQKDYNCKRCRTTIQRGIIHVTEVEPFWGIDRYHPLCARSIIPYDIDLLEAIHNYNQQSIAKKRQKKRKK